MTAAVRTEKLTVRLTPGERRAVERLADGAGLVPSVYVRETVLVRRPRRLRPHRRDAALHHLKRLIRRIDRVLELARSAAPSPDRAEWQEVLDQAHRTWRALLP